MAITKITDPSALPTATSDYEAQNNHINTHTLNLTPPYPVSGGSVLKGAIFNIGGDLFYTDADTAITGTSSDYVMITPSGSTATASYVTSLTTLSVAWSQAYNGYYDGSGNLFIFDEFKAYKNEQILLYKTSIWGSIGNSLMAIYNSISSFFSLLNPYGLTIDSSTGNLISTQLGSIVVYNGISSSVSTSFATAANTYGVAYDSDTGNLISSVDATNVINIHNGISSSVLSSFASPSSSPAGIVYDSDTGNLISCDFSTDLIYIHNGVTSSVLSSFASPGSNPRDLAIEKSTGNLISTDSVMDMIFIHNGITSEILNSYPSPGGAPYGIAYDGDNNRLISGDVDDDILYIHDRSYVFKG